MTIGCATRHGAVAAAAVCLLGASAAPAAAATTGGLEFSADGRSWSATVPTVFAGERVIVPGDEMRDVFWVRNGRDATVWVSLEGDVHTNAPGVPASGPDAPALQVASAGADGTALARDTAGPDARCVHVRTRALSPGEARRFETSLTLPWSSGNESQRIRLRTPLAVSAAEALLPTSGTGICAEPPVDEPAPDAALDPSDSPSTHDAVEDPSRGPGGADLGDLTPPPAAAPAAPARGTTTGLGPSGRGAAADGQGPLARTGADGAATLTLGGLLVSAGGLLLLAARRRRREDDPAAR